MNNGFPLVTGIHWIAVIVYVLASIINAYGLIFKKEKAERTGYYIAAAGLLIHGVGLILWWKIVGHGPYMGRFEVLSSISWVMLVLFLIFCKSFPAVRPASIFVFPSAFLLIALGLFFSPAVRTLPPTFRSIWLVLHVTFYKIAAGTIIIALVFSLSYILKSRTKTEWLKRLPDMVTIDMFAYRFAGLGFVFWAIAMLTGSIWAYQSWGRFWGWDPIETWSLITWVVFGIYLHLRRFFGWKGEKAAYFFVVCFLLSIITLFFLPFVESSIHSEYFR